MLKILLTTIFIFSANVLADNKTNYQFNIDRLIENYNENTDAAQAITFSRLMGTMADAKLMQDILKSSKENSLVKAEKVDANTVKFGDKLMVKFEKEKMLINGYEVNFSGKKSFADRIEYLQRIIKFNETKKKTKNSWLSMFISPVQAADESQNRDFARRLAASANSMWNWWLYDRYEYGNPEQFQSFQALLAIPEKTDLEVDCRANPVKDESFKGIVNYNPQAYLGRQNVMGEVKTNFPLKLTYTKPNGEKVVMWVTEAGNASTTIYGGIGAPRHVNVVSEGKPIESLEIPSEEIKKDYEFRKDTSTTSIARALVKCCEGAEKGKASCLSNFRSKLDKEFQINPERNKTIREKTEGVVGIGN